MKMLRLLALCGALITLSVPVLAHHDSHGDHEMPATASAAKGVPPMGVKALDCWIRNMPNKLPSAGYFKLINSSNHDAVLIGLSSDAYARTMLHTSTKEGGMAGMEHIDRVSVPAGGSVEFSPGGYHAMLEKPARDLQVGNNVTLVLTFEHGNVLPVECAVRAPSTLQ